VTVTHEPLPSRPRLDLGLVPIVDFDGTVADLPVDWPGLRRRLGVGRIEDLWAKGPDGVAGPWEEVTEAERNAAVLVRPLERMRAALAAVGGFAVLTSNSAAVVQEFCDRDPGLAAGLVTVVGREALKGPKTDFACFRAGFETCREATADLRGDDPVVYVGDQAYELDFARELGAKTIDASDPVDARERPA
jgi:hypothetical protein